MAKIIVTHEFDYYEEGKEARDLVRHPSAVSVLWDVDQELRTKLKHGEDEWLETGASEYLERLREMIYESGALNDY